LQADAGAGRPGDALSVNTALATRETEEQLGLDQRKRSDVQRRLSALGYLQGNADGNFNDNTRHAIERWQTARHYPRSGYFNKLQHDALLAERLPIRAADHPAPAAQRPQPQRSQAQQAPAQAQQQAPAAQQPAAAPAADPAGAAFVGGVLGGAIGNAIRPHPRP
jgi:peptidoglycan hydrolase-like protein with peptidoglycan-binding domain